MRLRLAALLVAACGLTAVPAVAANPALDDARKLTAKASVEYDVGHFDQALDLYTKAYERYPKPALLFDIGQCHRLLGHFERAIFFYQGYLRGKPEAANRALVEQFILDSQRQLDAQHATAAAVAPAPDAAPPPPPASPTAAPAPADAVTAPAAPPPSSPAAASPPPPPASAPDATASTSSLPVVRIAGFATAGVGVVLLGAAIVEGLQASSLSNQVSQISSQHGTWSSQAQSDYDAGKSAATTANVLYATGAIVLAAGAVITWWAWPKGPSTTAAVAPLPGGAALSLVSSF